MKSLPNIPFIAIVFIGLGVDYLLEKNGIYTQWTQVFGTIFGIQTLLLFIYALRDHSSAKGVWAVICGIIAISFFFPDYFGYNFWLDVKYYFTSYWPILLILLGVWMVVKAIRKKTNPI